MSLIVKIKKQLDNFMLSVDMELTNEVVSVIGMSGSGKSMTLKCIAGDRDTGLRLYIIKRPCAV